TKTDIFVRDTCLGALPACTPITVRATVDNNGHDFPGHLSADLGGTSEFAVSANGRYVAFTEGMSSSSTSAQIYVRDTCLGATPSCAPSTILLTSAGILNSIPSLSEDARYAAWRDQYCGVVEDTCIGAPAGCRIQAGVAALTFDDRNGCAESYTTPRISSNGR